MNDLRKQLGIDDWLELVKEDKNLDSAYISFAQYMYILENSLKQRDEFIDKLNKNWKELEKYVNENKMILNNPNILDFYLIQKEILQKCKGDD